MPEVPPVPEVLPVRRKCPPSPSCRRRCRRAGARWPDVPVEAVLLPVPDAPVVVEEVSPLVLEVLPVLSLLPASLPPASATAGAVKSRALTTFEKVLPMAGPSRDSTLMTTTETRPRISAYSVRPWPWRRAHEPGIVPGAAPEGGLSGWLGV